ncbi:hypothetical protein DFH09DRAFT_281504 [Mycena vulgaris]|nr:hypothetical protein DFH09DRAFT_281504 [Mycena vulgaris]
MPDLPELPDPSTQYRISHKFKLYEHPPPSRPEGGWDEMPFKFNEADLALEMQPNGRLENCRRHLLHPHTVRPALEVSLEQPLATGLADLRYAQVWKVQCGGKAMVARFYDPLYVDDDSGQCDIFRHIDRAVSLEVSAYEALKDLQGVMVPRFRGFFLTMVAAPDGSEANFERGVQVVLLEFIPGCDLLSLRPGDKGPMCDKHKTAIIDAVLLVYHLLVLRGVQHLDLSERNLILKDTPLSPLPFCADNDCQLRFKVPTESLVQQMVPAFNYSELTHNQLASIPVAVIDFEFISLVDDAIAKVEQQIARGRRRLRLTKEYLEDCSRPGKRECDFVRMWTAEAFCT